MKKTTILFLLILSVLSANATLKVVYISCLGANIASVSINCGDTIEWKWNGCTDSIVSSSIPVCGTPWNIPMSASNTTYQMVFTCGGTFHYQTYVSGSLKTTDSIIVSCVTSIPQLQNNNLQANVYPDPVTDKLNINANTPIENIQIVNILGETVMNSSFTQNKSATQTIDVSTLQAGVYFVSVLSEGKILTRRFVVIR
jgi:hypothetical protein